MALSGGIDPQFFRYHDLVRHHDAVRVANMMPAVPDLPDIALRSRWRHDPPHPDFRQDEPAFPPPPPPQETP